MPIQATNNRPDPCAYKKAVDEFCNPGRKDNDDCSFEKDCSCSYGIAKEANNSRPLPKHKMGAEMKERKLYQVLSYCVRKADECSKYPAV